MTVTVLKLSDADTYLKNISIKNIKDAALRSIADAYLRILGEAGDAANTNHDPLAADYTTIGVEVSLTANAAQLLNSVLHKKTPDEVGTVAKVTVLAQAAADLHALAKGAPEAEDAVALTAAQLTAIKTQLTKLGVSAAPAHRYRLLEQHPFPAAGLAQSLIAAKGSIPGSPHMTNTRLHPEPAQSWTHTKSPSASACA